jgi:DNA polymerase III gamma/tau subunit
MSAKLDEFFKKYSIDEISKRTKISPISLNYIKNREFDKLNKVKLKGFIKLIEREFKVSLLDDVMREYEEYYKSKAPKQEEIKEEIKEDKSIYFKILAIVALIIGGGILYILQKPKQSTTSQLTKPTYQENLSNTPLQKTNLKETTQKIDNNSTKIETKIETPKENEENITTPQIFNLKTNNQEHPKTKQENQQPTPKKENKPQKKETKKETKNKQIKDTTKKQLQKTKQTSTQKQANQKTDKKQEVTKPKQKKETNQETTQTKKQIQKTKQENKEVKQSQKTTTQNKPIKIVPLMKTWIKITNLKTNESKFIITDKPLTLPYGDYDIQFGFAKAKIYYNDKVINLNEDLIGEVILKNGKYTIK